jgi:hypothetical protein
MYGMGSSFGDDFTAEYLVRLAKEVQNNLALSHYGNSFDAIAADQQAGVTRAMQAQLQGIDLSGQQVMLPDGVARAIEALQQRISAALLSDKYFLVNRTAAVLPDDPISISKEGAPTACFSENAAHVGESGGPSPPGERVAWSNQLNDLQASWCWRSQIDGVSSLSSATSLLMSARSDLALDTKAQ